MSAYPILYEADYAAERSRLTVFFRWAMVIPHLIVGIFVGIAVFFTVIGAWFAVVITGRYPAGLYSFNSGALRWYGRFSAYVFLQTDVFPPFGFEEAPGYPVRIEVAPPLPRYSRAKAFFRIILMIPMYLIASALTYAVYFIAIGVWFIAVITGKSPRGLHDALDFCLAYNTKAYAYYAMITETYPPFSNENPTLEMPDGGTAISSGTGDFAPPTSGGYGAASSAFGESSERSGF